MPRATFGPEARLHSPSEYAAALKGRRLARGALFVLHWAPPLPGDASGLARLGLVVPKRHAPRASTRNAVKRVVREAFRQRRHALPAGLYVVRLQSRPAPASLTALKAAARHEADAHFKRSPR
ncbi:ribonuclease P protein component [Orrella sp. JC864]|uniref:ribonuclease P protein component n=1 Tax=Orrella sp. JC864 TaxID=3120298 RepID=UPI0012BD55C9